MKQDKALLKFLMCIHRVHKEQKHTHLHIVEKLNTMADTHAYIDRCIDMFKESERERRRTLCGNKHKLTTASSVIGITKIFLFEHKHLQRGWGVRRLKEEVGRTNNIGIRSTFFESFHSYTKIKLFISV